jgi:hypothetical protein
MEFPFTGRPLTGRNNKQDMDTDGWECLNYEFMHVGLEGRIVKAGYGLTGEGMPTVVSSTGGCVSLSLSCGKWNIVKSKSRPDSFLSTSPKRNVLFNEV